VLKLGMAASETLSVRLTAEARRLLAEAAPTHDAAGASALARDILERWAAETKAAKIRAGIADLVSYIKEHPEGWDDEPDDFFKGVPTSK
jgi:hypothetical protein